MMYMVSASTVLLSFRLHDTNEARTKQFLKTKLHSLPLRRRPSPQIQIDLDPFLPILLPTALGPFGSPALKEQFI